MSTSFTNLLSGGASAGRILQYRFITTNQTWTAPQAGLLDIFLTGGSPSGGVGYGSSYVGGSGAPGVCIKRSIPVLTGDAFIVTLGAGGAAVTRTTSGVTAGNVGTASTVTGPAGLSMTANPGNPGVASLTKPALGGAGGNATGGDYNWTGGAGGDVTATSGTTTACAMGAGACNVMGFPASTLRGGSINSSATGTASIATGGAGVGGRGGDCTGASGLVYTSGGGSGGSALDNTAAGAGDSPNILGFITSTSPAQFVYSAASVWGIDWFGGGGASPGPGGGSAANGTGAAAKAGIFAGPGGSYISAGGTAPSGVRGPGGSIVCGGGTGTSGAGDSGIAIFVLRG